MRDRQMASRTEPISGSPLSSPAPAPLDPPPSWSRFEHSAWWRKLTEARRSVLMLDYDGTLAPFVRDRMQAQPYTGISERLLRLSAAPRIRLVLISGRSARELASLLPPGLNVEIWGSHGRERLNPDGGYASLPLRPGQQGCLAQLEAALQRNGFARVIEKKVGSLAVHTRGLREDESLQIADLTRKFDCSVAGDTPNDSGLEWLPFDGGIELRGTGCTKATAVYSILRDEPPRTPAAYLGDDLTDEDAFTALRDCAQHLCLPVLVRPEPRSSAADLWLRPPDELLGFLDRWLAAASRPEDSE